MDSVGTAFLFTMNWNPSYSYSSLPPGYNYDSLPPHWKTILHKVEPPEKGIPHFKNIFVSDITAQGIKKIISATGLKESALQDFHCTNLKLSGADAGDVSFAKGWVFDSVTINAANGKILRITDSENMHVKEE